jgi:hypothetical protein
MYHKLIDAPKADDDAYVALSDVNDEYDDDFESEDEVVVCTCSCYKRILDIVRYRSSFISPLPTTYAANNPFK